MVTRKTLIALALSFPETSEVPHFDKTSFRVRGKIFATYDKKTHRACVKLSEVDQDVFWKGAKSSIYPVANAWGKQGWTWIELGSVKKTLFIDVITTAYCTVAPKALANQIRP